MAMLAWPEERAVADVRAATFSQPRSNVCLDFHGDPCAARLVVFSDGNHHMALADALREFIGMHPDVVDIFYATIPPRAVVEALAAGGVAVGNLVLTVKPHVFISPPGVLDRLVAEGWMESHASLAGSRGNVLLVRKGNPLGIDGIAALARDDVRIFLSNPLTESVSHSTYVATLRSISERLEIVLDFLDGKPHPRVIYGDCIHHREAPQAVADGAADVALVFHHLALRYTRIFPGLFDLVTLTEAGEDDPGQVRSAVHIGEVGNGGTWGTRFVAFMRGQKVAKIYRHHGLVPVD